jgi:hypothetical protein
MFSYRHHYIGGCLVTWRLSLSLSEKHCHEKSTTMPLPAFAWALRSSKSSSGICMDSQILKKFYCCTIESILTGCIFAWYGKCLASTAMHYRG